METSSLSATEAECASGREAPRVSLADINANIAEQYFFTADKAADMPSTIGVGEQIFPNGAHPLSILTICLVVTRNGFTIIGKSAPASAANFDAELGRKLAYEDAVRQLWPLMGYALRDKLHLT